MSSREDERGRTHGESLLLSFQSCFEVLVSVIEESLCTIEEESRSS